MNNIATFLTMFTIHVYIKRNYFKAVIEESQKLQWHMKGMDNMTTICYNINEKLSIKINFSFILIKTF